MPLAFVVAGLPVIAGLAPAPGGVKVTDAPETGFPKLSITVTWSGVANAVETVACCEFPPEIASAAAAPALITHEPLVAPVRPVLEAESVFVPIRFTERPGNVARSAERRV